MTGLQSLNEYANGVVRDAVDIVLQSDSQTLGHLIHTLRHSSAVNSALIGLADGGRFAKRFQADAEHWWDSGDGLPPSYAFLRPHFRAGPVFASVSLHLAGAAPTLILPVPAVDLLRHGPAGLRRSVWVNAPRSENLPGPDSPDALEFALAFSHAVTNTAMEVRVRDVPTGGWLARAHRDGRGLYIPDVRTVRDTSDVRTAAQSEERFLAMASVLYLPLDYEEIRQYAEPVSGAIDPLIPSPAVLMLWSPVPRRWDHIVVDDGLGVRPVDKDGTAFEILLDSARAQPTDPRWTLSPEVTPAFRWLDLVVALETKALRWAETQFLAPFFALHRASLDGSKEDARRFWDRIGHGFGPLAQSLPDVARTQDPRITTREWVARLLHAKDGPISHLRTRWPVPEVRAHKIGQARLTLRMLGPGGMTAVIERETLAEWPDVLDAVPSKIGCCPTRVVAQTARALALELAKNIEAYAERVTGIEIDITERYVVARYHLELKARARDQLAGNPLGFLRYFAVRRGIVVPTVESTSDAMRPSHGIGLALHSALSSRVGLYSALYISPDCARAHAALAMPYC